MFLQLKQYLQIYIILTLNIVSMTFSPFHFSRGTNLSFRNLWKTLPAESLGKAFGFWWMRLMLHAGNVLLLTLLISYFIAFFHASKLPILFLSLSIGILIGTLLFQFLLKRFRIADILSFTSLGAVVLLILGFSFLTSHFLWFFGVVLGVYAVGGIQMNILFFLLVEKSFSPLESEEAFPLIESAEPLGGILGGLIAFLGAWIIPPEYLLLFGSALFFCFFLILRFHSHHDHHHEVVVHNHSRKTWRMNFLFRYPMAFVLAIFVFLQGAIFIGVELMYSMAVGALFSHEISHVTEEVVATELAHGIGLVHVIIYAVLLVVQLFFASRIQHGLGVVSTLFLQPFFLLINALIWFVSGNFWTGIVGKGSYEVAGGLSKNSYHASFYAFPESVREGVKEFLEGSIRPLGMLMASLLLIIFSTFSFLWNWNFEGFYRTAAALVFLLLLLQVFMRKKVQDQYTKASIQNIHHSKNLEEQIDAVEILSQNGHGNALEIFASALRSGHYPLVIQKKIVQAYGRLQDADALPELIWCLNHSDPALRLTAVESLGRYSSLKKHFVDQSFSRYKIIESLQQVFLHADSKKLRLAVISVFQKIQYPEIAKFLIESLGSDDPDTVFCAVLGCSSFHDISTAYYVLPLLEHENSFIKSSAVVALWQFPRYRTVLETHINQMINSDDIHMKLSGVYTVGEVQYMPLKKTIENILSVSSDHHFTKHCLIALVKMGQRRYISQLVSLLFHEHEEISGSTKKLLFSPGVELSLQHHIRSFIRNRIIKSVRLFLNREGKKSLEDISPDSLRHLLSMYKLIEDEKMIWKIQCLLGDE